MPEVYMDESGIHEGAHVCTIAGYYGGENQWRKFETRWNRIIRETDTPALKEFHAIEFWKRYQGQPAGVYKGWTVAKADQFLTHLLACIIDYHLFPMTATLVVSEWKKLGKGERIFLTGGRYDRIADKWLNQGAPNKTYFLPFQFCVTYPAMACKEHLRVRYCFDLNKQFKNYATDLFALMKQDPRTKCRARIGDLSLLASEDAPGLQAADLLAYEVYQHTKVKLGGWPTFASPRPGLPHLS